MSFSYSQHRRGGTITLHATAEKARSFKIHGTATVDGVLALLAFVRSSSPVAKPKKDGKKKKSAQSKPRTPRRTKGENPGPGMPVRGFAPPVKDQN